MYILIYIPTYTVLTFWLSLSLLLILGEVASSEIRDTLEKSATLGIPSTPPMFT
jgi:hypothetical protein